MSDDYKDLGFIEDHDDLGFVPDNVEDPATSQVTAATTGMMNLGGWGPRLGALGDTVMKGVTGVVGPLAGGDLSDLSDNYHRTRDELQGEFSKAADANPVTSTVANAVGNAAALSPLGAAATTTKGLLGTGAALAAGSNNVDRLEDIPDALKSTAQGAVTNLVAGKLVNKVMGGAPSNKPVVPEGLDPNRNLGHAVLMAKRKAAGQLQMEPSKGIAGVIADRVKSGANSAANKLQDVASEGVKGGTLGAALGGYEGYRRGGVNGALEGAALGAVLGPKIGHGVSTGAQVLSKIVQSTPNVFGPLGKILQSAAARGAESLAITDRILQQIDPEYRKKRDAVLAGSN